MKTINNERGTVIIFVTLIVVLLLIIVGMGLDTGQLTYVRNQGQAAVDAAALAAVTGLPSRNATQIQNRAAGYNSTNDYVESPTNAISGANITYVQYDSQNNQITNYAANINNANGVRVALEQSTGSGITTPVFLTPLMNLLGIATPATQEVNVSAVAVISARVSIPIALWQTQCNGSSTIPDVEIAQQNPHTENSCWTCYLDNSCGASDVKALFDASENCTGKPAGVAVGTPIYENKGQVASVYETAEQFFMKDHPGKEFFIPVIDGTKNCNAKNPTPIVDWAKIKVTEVSKHGADSYIKADVTCQQNIDVADSSLCYSHKLVREPTKGY